MALTWRSTEPFLQYPLVEFIITHKISKKQPKKRVNDTDALMHAWIDYGIDSETGKESWEHLNKIHGLFSSKTKNADFVYVDCCFIVDTIRMIEVFGWRKLTPNEKEALYQFWMKLGKRMNIKDLPPSLEEAQKLVTDYVESSSLSRNTKGGSVLVDAINGLVSQWYFLPNFLTVPLMSSLLYVVGGKTFVEKLGLQIPSTFWLFLVYLVGTVRGIVLNFFPPRTQSHYLSEKLMKQKYKCCPAGNFYLVGPQQLLPKLDSKQS